MPAVPYLCSREEGIVQGHKTDQGQCWGDLDLHVRVPTIQGAEQASPWAQSGRAAQGVKLDIVGGNPAAYVPGATITWWGFSSCTLNIQVLENEQFLGERIFSIACVTLLTSCVLVRQVRRSYYLSDFDQAWYLRFRVLCHPKRGRADACSRCMATSASLTSSISTFICCAGTPLLIKGVLSKDASGLTIVQCEDHPSAPALIF